MASQTYTEKERNFFRAFLLLKEGGAPVLRRFLKENVRLAGFKNIDEFIQKHYQNLRYNKSLFQAQRDILFPINGGKVDIESFDISLITWLLRQFFTFAKGSTEAIKTIQKIRNEKFAHSAKARLEDSEFQTIWTNLESAILDVVKEIGDTSFEDDTKKRLQDIKQKSIGEFGQKLDLIIQKLGLSSTAEEESNLTVNTEERNRKRELQKFIVDTYSGNLELIVLPLNGDASDISAAEHETRDARRFTNAVHVNHMYVDVNVTELTPPLRKPPSDKTEENYQTSQSPVLESQNFAKTFDHLFQPPDWALPPRHVVLLGSAGRGKTTFCSRLVSSWCSAVDKILNGRDSDLSELERKIVNRFELVFFLSLRNAKDEENIDQMIRSQIFSENLSLFDDAIKQFKVNVNKILVIVDGLDERSQRKDSMFPKLDSLNHCSILWTSRHSELQLILTNLKNLRIFEIRELNDNNIRKLVQNVLKVPVDKLSEENRKNPNNDNLDAFMNILNKSGVRLFTEIPLVLTYLVCKWKENGGLEDSRTANFAGILDFLLANRNKASYKKRNDSSPVALLLPKVLDSLILTKQQVHLITELSKFAYECLIQSMLVFEIQKAIDKLGDENVAICLQTGVFVHNNFRCIQFFHKTLQDFLAAVWISMQKNTVDMDRLLKMCKSFEQFEENSDILIFVSGMSLRQTDYISKYVSEMSLKDDLFCKYRETLQGRYEFSGRKPVEESKSYRRVKKMQQIVLGCRNELQRNFGSHKGTFLTSHGVIYSKEGDFYRLYDVIFDDKKEKSLIQLLQEKETSKHLRSVYSDVSMLETSDELQTVICKTKGLEKLYLDHDSSSVITQLKLEQMKRIKSLCLVGLKSFPVSMNSLSKLSALCLSIHCQHSDVEKLEDFLKNSVHLKELELEEVVCTDHKIIGPCKYKIDLSKSQGLKILKLEDVFSQCTVLPEPLQLENIWISGAASNLSSCICQLPASKHLVSLVVGHSSAIRNWCQSDYEALAINFSELKSLESVHIIGVDFEQFDLVPKFYSKHKLKFVSLETIRLTEEGWKSLLLSLVESEQNECEAELNIISTNITKYNILSKIIGISVQNEKAKLAIDLSQPEFCRNILSLKY